MVRRTAPEAVIDLCGETIRGGHGADRTTSRPNLGSMVGRRPLSAAAVVTWAVTISWISVMPNPSGADLGRSLDWLPTAAHFTFYFGLTILSFLWLQGTKHSLSTSLGLVFLAAVSYGALMELVQSQVPGRTPSIWDVGVNAVGALAGVGLLGLLSLARSRGKRSSEKN
jgi:VanZ family protein